MMKRSYRFTMSWVLIAVLVGAPAFFGQAALASVETQNAAPTIFLSGPSGERFTLVRSEDDGWRLQAGQQTLERPLSVLVDGPTGFTFIYVLDEGWKFVGRVADGNNHSR